LSHISSLLVFLIFLTILGQIEEEAKKVY
jgi:hypothetical protein